MTVGTGYRVEQIGTGVIGITYLICTRIRYAGGFARQVITESGDIEYY